jgi:TolB-like protein
MVDVCGENMKKLSSFLPLVFLFVGSASASEANFNLAVLNFENNTFIKPEEVQSLSRGLAELVSTELARSPSIQLVERRKLQTLIDELKLEQAGVVSEESSIRVGKMLGAKHLVFGGFMVMPGDKIRIDTRIVEVETGLTLKAGEVTGKTKDVLTLVRRLGNKIITDLNARPAEEQEESQGKIAFEALKAFSNGVACEAEGDFRKAAECYRKALAAQSDFEPAKTRLDGLRAK